MQAPEQQNNQAVENSDFSGTYSPEDNKLRLYAACRLDEDLYQEVKKAGFRWAPKQELFYAHWSPVAEDLLIELCGLIGDETKSLAERAEDRAERFSGYSSNRANDADTAFKEVKEISDHIPFGQPILVGHHSEKRARRQAQKIENGMRRAVQMWETSEYWTSRAAGVLRSATYKDRAHVRVKRIKKLEAENRKYSGYYTPNPKYTPRIQRGWREEVDAPETEHTFCGSARTGEWIKTASLEALEKHYSRFVQHNEKRLAFEMAMLEGQGGLELLKPKKKATAAKNPLCNYRASEGIRIENIYHKGEFAIYEQVEMTKTEYNRINKDYKGTRPVEGTHRVRVAMVGGDRGTSLASVFLTDSKIHDKPEPAQGE